MSRHRRCAHGDLSLYGSVWRTSNKLVFEFPSAPFGCCVDHEVTVYNCYLLEAVVHTRHGEEVPDSAVGDLRSCRYKDGSCILPDASVLIWTPDQEEGCRFIPVARMKGFLMGNVWISESKEFALSWTDSSQTVFDCSKQLTVTDQGYAIARVRRVARAGNVDAVVVGAGLVTTNQLSTQLLAVEGAVQDAVAALFTHAVQALCERTNVLAIALHAALRTNPTLTMRRLTGRSDLTATHLGNGFVQVRRCVPVPPSSLSLQPFNGSCYAYPQVTIRLRSGSVWRAFLNPFTGVVVSRAPRIDCADATSFVLSANSTLLQFFPISGELSPVPMHHVRSVAPFSPLDALQSSPKLTVFHNLILTNFSEFVSDSQFQEMWTVRDQEKLIDHIAQVHLEAPASTGTEMGDFPQATPEADKDKAMTLADTCSIHKNGCLYKIYQRQGRRYDVLFLPQKLREPVCVAFHDSPAAGGHFSWKKTLGKIARKFFWPSMKEDVYRYVRS
uniref:Integrase_H2C2 domain-containing protein n=1 Tax=Haemonchus contortus TaxID=6289 RepID=A0A7I4YLW2_HAECO